MNLEDPKETKDKLASICNEIDQEIVYSIFEKLIYYSRINKLKGYKKSVIYIFAEV